MFKRTLVTSALPYANGPVHIGHLAGVYVPADIYTRYLRLKGVPVLFVGGSDEINGIEGLEVEYYEIVDQTTLQPATTFANAIGCVTVYCGGVRLIDNVKYN